MSKRPEDFANYDDYYKYQLNAGLEFQDFVVDRLYSEGIVIVTYASRRYQNSRGENRIGVEIKLDKKFRETKNLYIETAEKAHPSRLDYVSSGICRSDNSWLYAIGDYQQVYLFSKKYLLWLSPQFRSVETPTSQGFLLPLEEAQRHALRVFEFSVPLCSLSNNQQKLPLPPWEVA
jgi:hypothetical protein